MLRDRIDYYKTGQKLNNTPAQYKEEFPWLKEVDSLALANAQMNLNKAYHNILSKLKAFLASHDSSQEELSCFVFHEQPERLCPNRGAIR